MNWVCVASCCSRSDHHAVKTGAVQHVNVLVESWFDLKAVVMQVH